MLLSIPVISSISGAPGSRPVLGANLGSERPLRAAGLPARSRAPVLRKRIRVLDEWFLMDEPF
jgi:hypothetical protein